jgi:predicted O-methyltransferase YrrM
MNINQYLIFYYDNQEINKQNLDNIDNLLINNYNKTRNDIIKECNYCIYTGNNNRFVNQQIANLLWCIKILQSSNNLNICEIGFDAGYSSSLIANTLNDKPYNFYIFDLDKYNYTKPCFELFKSNFKNDNNDINFIEGNTITTIPDFINENRIGTFDFIHINSRDTKEYFDNDLKNADILIKNNGIIIIDDINIDYINDAVNYYINNNNYVELLFLELKINIHPHRIIQKK